MSAPNPRTLFRPAPPISGWTRRRWLAALCVAAAVPPITAAAAKLPAAPASPDQDISVRVQKAGPEIVVDVDCPVSAPVPIVWDVLTDYDHMATYISNLQFSGIQHRADNVLTVRQTGKVTRGLFTFAFDNVREVELVPVAEIRSRLISGDLKASAFTTRIVDLDGLVHISNSGRYTPNVWVPPLVGPALIEGETRKQYAEIRAEILRRAARRAASVASNHHGNDIRIGR
jgi:hypothetical protein